MGIIECPKCGNKISDSCSSCKYCGFDGIASYLLQIERDKFSKKRQEEIHERGKRDYEREHNIISQQQQQQTCTPKCPTCGSTNIQKISGTKRWLSTGLFGLASSDVGKTMVCKNCGYKW